MQMPKEDKYREPEEVEAPRQRTQHQNTWTVTQGGGMDVVFFGDTSGSMTEELETLGIEIQAFIDRLDDHVEDWQLMAITGPDGCAVNGILHPEDADYSAFLPMPSQRPQVRIGSTSGVCTMLPKP